MSKKVLKPENVKMKLKVNWFNYGTPYSPQLKYVEAQNYEWMKFNFLLLNLIFDANWIYSLKCLILKNQKSIIKCSFGLTYWVDFYECHNIYLNPH